jgi:hypothetical protein
MAGGLTGKPMRCSHRRSTGKPMIARAIVAEKDRELRVDIRRERGAG